MEISIFGAKFSVLRRCKINRNVLHALLSSFEHACQQKRGIFEMFAHHKRCKFQTALNVTHVLVSEIYPHWHFAYFLVVLVFVLTSIFLNPWSILCKFPSQHIRFSFCTSTHLSLPA